jgi:hypothetical protein
MCEVQGKRCTMEGPAPRYCRGKFLDFSGRKPGTLWKSRNKDGPPVVLYRYAVAHPRVTAPKPSGRHCGTSTQSH